MKNYLVLITNVVLLASVSVTNIEAEAGTVQFKIISGHNSGLKAIMGQWNDDEVARSKTGKRKYKWWPWGLTAIDIDNDGDMDLLPGHHGGAGGLIIKNELKETGQLKFINFSKVLNIDNRQLPSAIGLRTIAMDMNNDGWMDFTGLRSPNYINEKGKNFIPKGKGFSHYHPIYCEDINQDGYLDVIEPGRIRIFDPKNYTFGRKNRNFTALEDNLPKSTLKKLQDMRKKIRFWGYGFITDHDLNHDGINDLVVKGFAAYNKKPLGYYYLIDKDGELHDVSKRTNLPKNALPNLFLDVNNDGFIDVFLTESASDSGLYLNNGNAQFTHQPGPLADYFNVIGPYSQRIYPVDFDADGDSDLVTSNPRIKIGRIFENIGNGQFIEVHQFTAWDSNPVAIRDINGDNLIDVAVGGPGNDITIYLNKSKTGNFVNLYSRMKLPNWTAAGAIIEVFKTAQLNKAGARPFHKERAHADGSPIFIGLGKDKTFDLRITFPTTPKKIVTLISVAVKPRIQVMPDGSVTEPELGAYITKPQKNEL